MRTKIIERSTGMQIADCSKTEDALLIAIRRHVENSDMLFVMGVNDIKLHKFASFMLGEYLELMRCHHVLNSVGPKVEQAPERRDLWWQIKGALETRKPDAMTKPLCEVIGKELADDVERLMVLATHEYVRIPGIDKASIWREAYQICASQANRYRDRQFDLMVHEALGILIVAPHEAFANRRNFVIKNSIGPKRRPLP